MTSKRSPHHPSELDHSTDPDSPSTLRSIEAAEVTSPDHESPPVPVYYEPQPLVAVSDHKTIEVETIKLAEDIDPRKLPTELRLARPSVVPPDSGWPQAEVVVVSSQPPLAGSRRWRAPVVLLALLAALLLLVLARVVARRAHAGAPGASAAAPVAATTPALTPVVPPPAPTPTLNAALVVPAEPLAAEVAPLPGSRVAAPEPPAPKRAAPEHLAGKLNSRSIAVPPNASSRALVEPNANKPKRAIY